MTSTDLRGEGFACFRWACMLYRCDEFGPMDIDHMSYAVWRWKLHR